MVSSQFGICCTPKFALSFFKVSLTMILKVQAWTNALGFSSTKVKRKLSKREKIDKNIILTKLEKYKCSSISFLRVAFWPLSTQAWLASFDWELWFFRCRFGCILQLGAGLLLGKFISCFIGTLNFVWILYSLSINISLGHIASLLRVNQDLQGRIPYHASMHKAKIIF